MTRTEINELVSRDHDKFPHPLPKFITWREITINGRACRVYVYEHWSGGLVWTGYRANGNKWAKIPCFTRAEERRYPIRLAKLGAQLLTDLNQFKTAEGRNAFAAIQEWLEAE